MKKDFGSCEQVTIAMSILLVIVTSAATLIWKGIYDIYKG